MLQLRGLSFGFPPRPALFQGLDLDIPPGGSIGLLGPSGSGKSTLLRLLSGKLEPEVGQVLYGGKPVVTIGRDLTFEKDFLFALDQGIQLPAYRRVRELFRIRMRHLPHEDLAEAIERLADDFGITALLDQSTETLSLGQAQRVGLALSVCKPDQYVVLDEPFSHQDPLNRQRLLFLLVRYARQQALTYIVASHSAEDCMILTDRCLYLTGNSSFTIFPNWMEFYTSSLHPETKAYFEYLSGKQLVFRSGPVYGIVSNELLQKRFLGLHSLEIAYDAEGFPSLKVIPNHTAG